MQRQHQHLFSRYYFRDGKKGRSQRFWNPLITIGLLGAWYVGWECRCGAQGYNLGGLKCA